MIYRLCIQLHTLGIPTRAICPPFLQKNYRNATAWHTCAPKHTQLLLHTAVKTMSSIPYLTSEKQLLTKASAPVASNSLPTPSPPVSSNTERKECYINKCYMYIWYIGCTLLIGISLP